MSLAAGTSVWVVRMAPRKRKLDDEQFIGVYTSLEAANAAMNKQMRNMLYAHYGESWTVQMEAMGTSATAASIPRMWDSMLHGEWTTIISCRVADADVQ